MKQLCLLLVFILGIIHSTYQQHVAPGVPPQQYQQVPQHVPQHQYQQQQQQQQPHMGGVPQQQMHQQVPVHQVPQGMQQQVPMHQQVPIQQQIPVHQQVPVHQQHHGHTQHGQLLNANIQQEKEHIQEHMDVPMDTSKMTEQELQFHYFKMHDADNNNKLDGCELIKSLIHWHEQGHKDPHNPGVEDKIFKDDELIALIDPILKMDDANNDGYIDYPEFIRAQQKAAANTKSNQV